MIGKSVIDINVMPIDPLVNSPLLIVAVAASFMCRLFELSASLVLGPQVADIAACHDFFLHVYHP
jgi:hypothetical protein